MINHRGLLDGWLVVELNDAVHVVPNNDVRFHMVTQGMGCACEPELWRGGMVPLSSFTIVLMVVSWSNHSPPSYRRGSR